MKKPRKKEPPMRSAYDFSKGVHGKYADRYGKVKTKALKGGTHACK